MWSWPLRASRPPVPERPHPGAFGTVRRHDVHTGVDLYCPEGELVTAVEPGIVTFLQLFTGPRAESPWWEETWCVGVEGPSGVVVYGEIFPAAKVGDVLAAGGLIGSVKRVLRHDKGLPLTMLHLELYRPGTRQPAWWRDLTHRPPELLDPTPLLRGAV